MSLSIQLSEVARRSTVPSPVNHMMAQFASDFRDGVDVNLGVGYINEQTIPVQQIRQSLDSLLAQPEQYRLPFNYGGPAGTENLVQAIRAYLVNASFGLTPEVLRHKTVVVGPSGATSLLDGIATCLSSGLVITSDPMYYIYCEMLRRRGFEVVAVPEDSDGIRMDLLQERLALLGQRLKEIQFFYIVTVNNPSCTVLSNERRHRLLQLVSELSRKQQRLIPLIFDRAYEDLIHDDSTTPSQSMLPHDELGVVHEIGTLSKVLAPALRIGYMAAAPSPFVDALIQRTSDVGFSAPVITQELAAVMMTEHLDAQLARVNEGYRQKSRAVRQMIDHKLSPYLSHVEGGRAGFYYYVTFRNIETTPTSPFFAYCTRTTSDNNVNGTPLHRRVVYIPGAYCVHPNGALVEVGKRQLRISYGFEDLNQIENGLNVMKQAAQYVMNIRLAP